MRKNPKNLLGIFMILMIALVMGNGLLPAAQDQDNAPVVKEKSGMDSDDEKSDKEAKEETPQLHYEVTVTATRNKRETFETPRPVSVVNRKKIEEIAPNNVTELLTELPGVDVNSVGANQSRPIVRGFRGQRILLMEDGIRMNNSRRQQDFGEIPGLVDVSEVDRVEVVRGPASVLYGSDAIGGVINIITRFPQYDPEGTEIHGNIGYRHSTADDQNKGFANFNGHVGKLGFMISGNYRKAGNYMAPAGTFGDIQLTEDTTVQDTGVEDHGVNFQLNYNISRKTQVSFKYENYNSKNAGFGFIDPEIYNPGSARIQIQYPMQKVNKYTFKYENRELGFALADHLSFTAYHLNNERELSMNIYVKSNSPFLPPDAAVEQVTENFTDVETLGFRLELNKGIKNHTFTYGADFFQDNTANTDYSMSQMLGFGFPMVEEDYTPQVPNADYRSMGVFVQDDISLFKRTSLILGLRYQNVNAKTKETVGLEGIPTVDSTDQTVVGSANLIYGITDNLRLVFSVGRGFRSPNLIERFFKGVTPEGSGYQLNNTELDAETSLNFDVGFKYRRKNVYFEATYFNNVIYDGIRLTQLMDENGNPILVDGLPEYQNVNVDKLRMQGVEAMGSIYFKFGLSMTANYTKIKSKDLGRPETPYVDTYSSKFNFGVRYDHPGKLFYVGYNLRVNGDQKDVLLVDNPLGDDKIPGFTVHSINAGVTLFRKSRYPQQIGIIIGNLTNQLYAEFSNASFFRPAPRRHVVLTWSTRF